MGRCDASSLVAVFSIVGVSIILVGTLRAALGSGQVTSVVDPIHQDNDSRNGMQLASAQLKSTTLGRNASKLLCDTLRCVARVVLSPLLRSLR